MVYVIHNVILLYFDDDIAIKDGGFDDLCL